MLWLSNSKLSAFNQYTIPAFVFTIQYELSHITLLLREYDVSYLPFKGMWEWGRAGPDHLICLIFRFKPVFLVWHITTYTVDIIWQVCAPVSLVQSSPSSHWAACHCQAWWPPINISIQQWQMPHFHFPFATIQNSMEQPISLSLSSSSEELFYEIDEGESNSEWYTRGFSKTLISSPIPTTQNSPWPKSMFIPCHSICYSHLPLHQSPMASLLLVNNKAEEALYWTTHHFLSQCLSAPHLPLLPSSPLPLLAKWTTSCPFPTSLTSFHSHAQPTPASSLSCRPLYVWASLQTGHSYKICQLPNPIPFLLCCCASPTHLSPLKIQACARDLAPSTFMSHKLLPLGPFQEGCKRPSFSLEKLGILIMLLVAYTFNFK